MCLSWLLTMEFVVFLLKKIYYLSSFQQVLFRERYVFLNKLKLGSGLVIFKERKPGYAGGTEVPMRTLFYLSENQLERIKPFFPRSHGALRVDDRRVGVSAASSTSSNTDFSGRMFLMSTARTDPCTTVLSGGVSAEFSKKISISCQIKRLSMAP